MTITENVFLGNEIRTSLGLVDEKAMNREVTKVLGKLGLEVNPKERCKNLGVGQLQLVEIAKALIHHAQLIVMDEPTSALTDHEIDRLFTIIQSLKQEGVSFVYISHRLEELFTICERLTVLRDGD